MAFLTPLDFPGSPLSQAIRQPLLLGLFLPIQAGGWSPSLTQRTTDWRFPYIRALVEKAEALDFDLVFGLAQWVGKGGYGGELSYREDSLDPFITAAALSSVTKKLLLIATVHVLYGSLHPLHLAKYGATLDHISGGRFGFNIVTGYAPREPKMFGADFIEHDRRYALTDEFITLAETLWGTDANVDFAGERWQAEQAFVSPRPVYGRPVLVNATGSAAGFGYAARHSDLAFITSPAGADIDAALAVLPDHVAKLKGEAAALGRQIKTIINPTLVVRPTEAEARDYHAAILAGEDKGAVDGFIAHHNVGDSQAWTGHKREQRVLGGNIHIIGSPEQVVARLQALKATGIDGVQLSFFDFAPDLDYFGSAVLPLLYQAGLRV